MNKFIAYILLFSIILLGSCQSSRKLVGERYDRPDNTLLENVAKAVSTPEFCSFKIKATLNANGKTVSANSVIRIDGENLLLMSVTVPILGIEVGRMEADAKEIRIIDKMERRYVSLTFKELSEAIGAEVSYNTVKSLFMGRIFSLPSRDIADARKLSRIFSFNGIGNSAYTIVQKDLDGRLKFEVSDNGRILSRTFVSSDSGKGVEWRYGNYEETGGFMLPNTMKLTAMVSKFNIQLDMQVRSIDLGRVKAKPLNLERYSKIPFDRCIEILNKY